jgi:hypothetical protein
VPISADCSAIAMVDGRWEQFQVSVFLSRASWEPGGRAGGRTGRCEDGVRAGLGGVRCGWEGARVPWGCLGLFRLLRLLSVRALGILVCAGAGSEVTARAISPSPGPGPRLRAREEIGGLAAGWVLISMREEGTETANAVVTGNARGRAQGLDDVRSSQRVSACVHTAVANACTLCR